MLYDMYLSNWTNIFSSFKLPRFHKNLSKFFTLRKMKKIRASTPQYSTTHPSLQTTCCRWTWIKQVNQKLFQGLVVVNERVHAINVVFVSNWGKQMNHKISGCWCTSAFYIWELLSRNVLGFSIECYLLVYSLWLHHHRIEVKKGHTLTF